MNVTRDDVIKFEALHQHYNPVATNIGIIGDKDYFKAKINILEKSLPHDLVILDMEKLKCRFLFDDKETTYYGIQTLDDLKDLYFRKYI